MPDLFHATTRDLPLNQEITGHQRNIKPIDQQFDARRPNGVVARSTALFSSNDPAFAFIYLVAESVGAGAQLRLFEVDMVNATRHPMILVNHAQIFADVPDTLEEIIAEYWNPTRDWRCCEHLATTMTPIAIEPTPDFGLRAGARHRYGQDRDLANQLWARPRRG